MACKTVFGCVAFAVLVFHPLCIPAVSSLCVSLPLCSANTPYQKAALELNIGNGRLVAAQHVHTMSSGQIPDSRLTQSRRMKISTMPHPLSLTTSICLLLSLAVCQPFMLCHQRCMSHVSFLIYPVYQCYCVSVPCQRLYQPVSLRYV